jgi:hypothetical protein
MNIKTITGIDVGVVHVIQCRMLYDFKFYYAVVSTHKPQKGSVETFIVAIPVELIKPSDLATLSDQETFKDTEITLTVNKVHDTKYFKIERRA